MINEAAMKLNVSHEAGTTTVKVKFTVIKYVTVLDDNSSQMGELKLIGKISMPECKKQVKELEGENVFVNRELVNETFEVDTLELYTLKLPENK